MSKTIQFTDDNFVSDVLASDQPVLVDFWAPWCGPCRALGPTIDELADQFDGTVKIGKLNVDENPETSSQFGITSIPAVVLFHRGEIVETWVGVQHKREFESTLQRFAA